ncbi:hypothetical protein Tco_0681778 [Tanacetum coccineum]|uniref:Uncharacterized protein n=1 Tax=Tanacetum coccineum TaxID=301880 RepID=A0ABQ4XPJ8_9ASTR
MSLRSYKSSKGISESLFKTFYISGLKPALQCELLRSNPKTLDEVFSLVRATEARFTDLQLWELLKTNPTTLGEAFFKARITEARFEDENNQAVDNNFGNQEDPSVSDKQEVKKADDEEIENVKDEEGKNVEGQHGSVRSIGVAIKSDVANFGREVRDIGSLRVYEL